jgi:hypothetical protein
MYWGVLPSGTSWVAAGTEILGDRVWRVDFCIVAPPPYKAQGKRTRTMPSPFVCPRPFHLSATRVILPDRVDPCSLQCLAT